MGQVPANPNYALVGDGRLARHLAHYFNLLKIPHLRWSRRIEAERGISAAQALQDASVVLVAISDAAIEPWIESYRASSPGISGRQMFVHFSGSLVTSLAIGAHPLMTFGTGFYELSEYEKTPFVCELGGPSFQELFPKLPNPSFAIRPESKALYHALCVMSGNFTVLLWQKMFGEFEKTLGVPMSAAVPYLDRVAKNLKTDPSAALTGPLVRGDRQTIEKNLESLSGDRFRKVYESFVDAYVEKPAEGVKDERS